MALTKKNHEYSSKVNTKRMSSIKANEGQPKADCEDTIVVNQICKPGYEPLDSMTSLSSHRHYQ